MIRLTKPFRRKLKWRKITYGNGEKRIYPYVTFKNKDFLLSSLSLCKDDERLEIKNSDFHLYHKKYKLFLRILNDKQVYIQPYREIKRND